jgi:hypothetical protein
MSEELSYVNSGQFSVDTNSRRPSMIYNVLPAMVQNRMPAIPSLRRAISEFRGLAIPERSDFDVAESIHPISPPPGYTTRPGSATSSGGNMSNRTSFAFSDGDTTVQDDLYEGAESVYSAPSAFCMPETSTGINWRYANQGTLDKPVVFGAANSSKE